ncbi:MAG TPA: DUF86 domain-containing protein [Actinomycetospora sp.]|uniref:type VII toxin-antitoxin system HepT family RNase toxin n=1 Tax=Actinomycetospora sp. TaxID=1872135 RepID=UPI002F42A676
MTPRPLDWRSVGAKLRRIEDLLDALEAMGPVTADRLRSDITTSLAVERVLTLVVELAFAVNTHVAVARLGRAPDTYPESFDAVADAGAIDPGLAAALMPSAKMRNVLVHAYLDVDHEIVATAVPLALTQYRSYTRQIARWFQGLSG